MPVIQINLWNAPGGSRIRRWYQAMDDIELVIDGMIFVLPLMETFSQQSGKLMV